MCCSLVVWGLTNYAFCCLQIVMALTPRTCLMKTIHQASVCHYIKIQQAQLASTDTCVRWCSGTHHASNQHDQISSLHLNHLNTALIVPTYVSIKSLPYYHATVACLLCSFLATFYNRNRRIILQSRYLYLVEKG